LQFGGFFRQLLNKVVLLCNIVFKVVEFDYAFIEVLDKLEAALPDCTG